MGEWVWEWEEWEAVTDTVVDGADLPVVVGALVQDLGVADLALGPEVDLGAPEVEEVDVVEGITLSSVRLLA
ncbi:hypothetical protein N7494_010665 [Penicillium frequentans]|uniref:Uncharacterized protein n=1 Tax=Penicillium frequentans TaxID=3151616 RepID=A0AAD6GA02_9EURO|nr:hypothetical protein N7494_010665 [Penicillium glabrum]